MSVYFGQTHPGEKPMRKPRFSEAQIVKRLKQAETGRPVAALCRESGIGSIKFYKCKSKYGGMELSDVRHLAKPRPPSEALKQISTLYRSIVENQTELISIHKSNGICIFVNDAYCRFFGQSKEHFVGNYWFQHTFPEDIPGVHDNIASLTPDNPVVVTEHRVINGSSEVCWVQFIIKALFHSDGTLKETQVVGRDITEHKQSAKIKDDVERIIRHDIKAPLASLIALTHLISKGRLNEQLLSHLPSLYNAVRQIVILMDSKEKIEKMESEAFTPQTTKIKFTDIYQNIAMTLADLLAEKNITLTHKCDGLILYGDEYLVEGMLQNIIKNTVELSPPDTAVTILHRETTPYSFIDIHSKAPIPRSTKDSFFETISANEKSLKTKLGAYHAKLIAKAHGGDIDFTDLDSNGTTLTIKLKNPMSDNRNMGS